jgi:hypothetical protein
MNALPFNAENGMETGDRFERFAGNERRNQARR